MKNIVPFIINHWVLFIALAFVLALLIGNEMKRKLLGYKELKPNEAVLLMNHDDAAVIDIRDNNDFTKGHILKAIHVPFALLDGKINDLKGYQDAPLIVCCRSGQQSARAAVTLRRHGFSKIYKLAGGMLAWESAGLPTTRS